ncbi:MAG: molybdopterin molybdotransferase MoeA [Pyrinomonadaceae bacterium]|nr:molybdopterin molybdotransferase MoeA [Sphingobacteriaceae bacterium]
MISYREAQETILSEANSFGIEIISLDNADGRVLAESVFADRDYPPFNRSAMDGYAIRTEDWDKGIREFEIQEVIYAGELPTNELKHSAAFKIMTGAAVPSPANAVIRREDALTSGNTVSFLAEFIRPFQNIARKGEDLIKDCLAIDSHTLCSPAVISTLATLGKSEIRVEALPKVALFTTGNEVKPLDALLKPTEIRNSNYHLLKSLLKTLNITASIYKHLPDNKVELKNHLQNAVTSDVIIMSGGVSAGDADYVPEVLESIGVKKLFHKVAIKPGKPFWCGKMINGPMVFALPGNPFSSYVTFKIFIEPFLCKSVGLLPPETLRGIFKGEKTKKTTFDEFFPVKLTNFGKSLIATGLNGSGDIRLGIDADALAIHPSDTDTIIDGQELNYYLL